MTVSAAASPRPSRKPGPPARPERCPQAAQRVHLSPVDRIQSFLRLSVVIGFFSRRRHDFGRRRRKEIRPRAGNLSRIGRQGAASGPRELTGRPTLIQPDCRSEDQGRRRGPGFRTHRTEGHLDIAYHRQSNRFGLTRFRPWSRLPHTLGFQVPKPFEPSRSINQDDRSNPKRVKDYRRTDRAPLASGHIQDTSSRRHAQHSRESRQSSALSTFSSRLTSQRHPVSRRSGSSRAETDSQPGIAPRETSTRTAERTFSCNGCAAPLRE